MKQQNKNRILILCAIFITILVYKFGISETLMERSKCEQLKAQINQLEKTSNELAQLKHLDSYYDSLLLKQQWSEVSLQNSLLNAISSYAFENQLHISAFQNPHKVILEDGHLITYSFSLKGPYNKLIQLAYNLEYNHNFGETIHLNLAKNKDHKTRADFLHMRILLQNTE